MRILRLLGLIGVVSVGLVGCASGEVATEEFAPGFDTVEAMPDMMDESVTSGPMEVGVDQVAERSVIVTGDVYLTVDDPLATADRVEQIVTDAGGRVDSRSEYAAIDNREPSAYLWVRIPVDRLDDTLDLIEALGVVESQSISNQDVTLQVVDLDARIAVLDESIERLRALLADAETTADLVEIETALSERQAELDSLNSQRNYLTDQVQYASIGVDLRSPEVAPEREPDGFVDGIIAGWQGMLAFFAGTIVFLGVIVPWVGALAVVSLIIATVVWLRRRATKS